MYLLKMILRLHILILLTAVCALAHAQQPLQKAVSHNDYLQPRPLMDALEEGYVNIEVDIFFHHGNLVVAHWFPYGKQKSTLEKLYLLPLAEHIRKLRSQGEADKKPFMLLIDIKSSPESTYDALKILLNKYRWMLSSYQGRTFVPGPVTIVLTGRKPENFISGESNRLVMMDAFLNAPSRFTDTNLFALASCKYSWIIKSREGLTQQEKNRLSDLVELAHSQGKKTRLWASPENDQVRKDLLDCGIDLINTDHLKDLKRFLYELEPQPALVAKVSEH